MSSKKNLLLFLLAAALCSAGCMALLILLIRLIRWGFGDTEHSKAVGLLLTAVITIVSALLPAVVYNIFRKRFELTKDPDKTPLIQCLIWLVMCYAAAAAASQSETILSLYKKRNVNIEDDERALGLISSMLLVSVVSIILTAVINAVLKKKKSNFKEKNDV